jgi:hypothetical protein
MRYVYTVNSIGLDKIVFFASKRAALNYAKRHNIRKLSNGHYGIFRVLCYIAADMREDYRKLKERIDKQNVEMLISMGIDPAKYKP